MEQNPLDEVLHRLRVPGARKNAIERELASHVAESRHELLLAGWRPEDADREALSRLGEPVELAEAFTRVHRPARRLRFGMAMVLATSMLLGAYGLGGQFASAHAIHPARSHLVVQTHTAHP